MSSCREVDALLVRDRALAAGAAEHVATCPRCAGRVAAWRRVRRGIAGLHADARPDAGFSARVVARIDDEESGFAAVGWAARRLLPVALALVLALGGWSASLDRPAALESLLFARPSGDDLAAFVLSAPEDAR